jgi:4a-hydroxytetrahydrobiopterin dehydratase
MSLELRGQHCLRKPQKLNPLRIDHLTAQLQGNWAVNPEQQRLSCQFDFNNYHETMAFVNAIAWIAHQQDHHPDLLVSYHHCTVNLTTHSIAELSDNDFICADLIDQLLNVCE